jgi:hypothetical protein
MTKLGTLNTPAASACRQIDQSTLASRFINQIFGEIEIGLATLAVGVDPDDSSGVHPNSGARTV